ncbi:hypothetical protein BIW11_06569 [Tropilaelaps mercedesae]|uniref:Uncharacterized protein n=1 Tax=Tropilaelaps mercedesae TaxID=418985 RepID=A0A1V9XXL0_9ACAR|nr:hypothetical protein BIW11_06569 [Tropilaelaps mercedesae]
MMRFLWMLTLLSSFLFTICVKAEHIDVKKTIVFEIDKRLSAETDRGGYYHMYVNTFDRRCCKVRVTIQANAAPLTDSECCNPGRCSSANLC